MNKKSSILIVTVWMTLILTLMSVSLYHLIFSPLKVISAARRSMQGYYAACGIVEKIRCELQARNYSLYSLNDLPFCEETEPGMSISAFVADESSKLNINKADIQDIQVISAISQEDLDEIQQERGHQPYASMLQLPELNESKNLFTVFGDGSVNINTAPQQVLFAVGVDEVLAGDIIQIRKGQDMIWGTADDVIFGSLNDLAMKMGAYDLWQERYRGQIERLISLKRLDFKTGPWIADVTVLFENTSEIHYHIVIDKNGVLDWQEW